MSSPAAVDVAVAATVPDQPGEPVPAPPRRPGWRSSTVIRQASALMSSTMIASVLNMLFWVAAARLYPTDEVGHGNATVSAIALVSGLAQLNLLSVFLRFLPHAGRRTTMFLTSGYAAILVASVLLGGGYLLLGLRTGFGLGAGADAGAFVLAVVVFALFWVQDGVLTTFGLARGVLVKNVATAAGKLALLVALVAAGSSLGIAAAWCIPTAVATVVVSVAIFARLAPARSHGEPDLPGAASLGNFIAAEYVNNLVGNVVTLVPPLVVLHLSGATANAYFAVPWLIVVTVQTLVWNIMMSFIAQSGRDPDGRAAHGRRTAALVTAVAFAGTAGLVLLAPLLLAVQGGAFAEQGSGLLRVAALSFPFTAVIIFYSAFAMLESRLWRAVAVQAVSAVGFLGGAVYLLPRQGIAGVGVAYLITQAAAALVLLPGLLRRLRSARLAVPGRLGTLLRWTAQDLRTAGRHTWLNTVAGSRLMPRVGRHLLYRAAGVRTRSPNVLGGTVVDGRPGNLRIGPGVFMNAGCYLECVGPIDIGAGVMLGMRVTILTSHHPAGPDGRPQRKPVARPVTIGERAWIGAGATILPGVTIGADVVIGAGAVVSRDCAPGGVYAGNPARLIKRFTLVETDKTPDTSLDGGSAPDPLETHG